MDPQKITELANLLRNNGDKILNSEFTLTLSGALLRALNDSFTLIAEAGNEFGSTPTTFQVVKPINSKSPVFRDLQLIHDFVQKTALLCIVHYPAEDYFEGIIDISKFRSLKRLEVQKTQVRQIVGLQPLRAQLQQLICVKSLRSVDEIITRCGGDNWNGFVWNELKIADFSYNNLQTVDTSLEFAQHLQYLNLRHNQLHSVEAIKWLPQLKTLDLSYNRLQCIPQFHMEAYNRLQSLNMSNNLVEDLMGIAKMDALTDLDLSDNCLLDHCYLLPLSALLTLKYLNLYGNPLHCHPKHRLATAQFLHKNAATVKFILDFEPLSKSEKAITGSQQLRGGLRFISKSSSVSICSSGRQTPHSRTPTSSVGSLRSFEFEETAAEAVTAASASTKAKSKKRLRTRTVDFEDVATTAQTVDGNTSKTPMSTTNTTTSTISKSANGSLLLTDSNAEYLETKRQIKTLREKYGAQWLQSGNTEMMHSVLGIESPTDENTNKKDKATSRQLLSEFLGEIASVVVSTEAAATTTTTTTTLTTSNQQTFDTLRTSTPTFESSVSQKIEPNLSPIKSEEDKNEKPQSDSTLYCSIDEDTKLGTDTETTIFRTAIQSDELNVLTDDDGFESQASAVENDEEDAHLKHVYAKSALEESDASEPEDDDETYIVYPANSNEAIFLTISANFLREKDTLTQRTKTKWSLRILESCERMKSNMLRINFDTVKLDKQERVYTAVEEGLCQELEKRLRDVLSQRDLTEMNQTIYRCVNCACQFSRENKKQRHKNETCPNCKSTFIAEVHEIPKSLDRATNDGLDKLSPASIVEEATVATTPLLVHTTPIAQNKEESNSIGSANSLNESSSCSKISNSQSSFDSNQSVVGSTTTERDNDFKSTGESDVDILSNPSQSSIEVLDQMQLSSNFKSSEERRISQIPNLETIDDHSYTQSFIEREFGGVIAERQPTTTVIVDESKQTPTKVQANKPPLAHFNLTESSSSGSVTDSVCTAYEQQQQLQQQQQQQHQQHQQQQQKPSEDSQKQTAQIVLEEENEDDAHNDSTETLKDTKDSGISSMFGALFQSTNILMSSSKKLIDAEATANIKTGTPLKTTNSANSTPSCQPYKFNYSDFTEVDHRLKLYFYQTKFEETGEHFKWIVRGRIFNECTQTLCDGIVVMSTYKCYLMEAFAPEHDDVTKWLRHTVTVTVDRLECVQLLPWKLGVAFVLRDWGGFLLLLQDILRTDSLLLHFQNNTLPAQCELQHQPAEQLAKRLNDAVADERLEMCSLLNNCEVTRDQAKRCFNISVLLTTDAHLYLTSSKLSWLSLNTNNDDEPEIELCHTQLMSNLVHIERPAENLMIIKFVDEMQDKCELWHCTFETKENADSCAKAIANSWEQLFSVPLFEM